MVEHVFPVRVFEIRHEAEDVLSFVLRRPDGSAMPPVDPGAHVDVKLPNGLMRSYSLSNGARDDGAYRLTVAKDAQSAGGSTFLHDELRTGQLLEIGAPRNNFVLAEDASLSVFFAGGIGITPFVPMIRRLNELGRRWRIYYAVRTRERAALVRELEQMVADGNGELFLNFDGEAGGRMLDLQELLARAPSEAHVYCCGPSPMLDSYRAAAKAADLPDEQVHFEYFQAHVAVASEGGFVVECVRSGLELTVEPGKTILDVLTDAGIDVSFSCAEGICGSCETKVLGGEPDHRDMILSDRDRARNDTMMICCSGSKTSRLVLDI